MRGPRARILPWHIGASNHNTKISRFITHLANKSSIAHQPRPKYFAKYRLPFKSKQHMQKKIYHIVWRIPFWGKVKCKQAVIPSDSPHLIYKALFLYEWYTLAEPQIQKEVYWLSRLFVSGSIPWPFIPINVAGHLFRWQFICSLVTLRLESSAATKAMTALSCRILLNESCQDRFIYNLMLYPLA